MDALTNNIRQVMESTDAWMRILDLDCNVVIGNERMKKMGGVNAEESALIMCYDQFCSLEVRRTDNCRLKQIVDEDKDEIRVEVEKESYDGRVVPTELVVRPLHDEAGNAVVGKNSTLRIGL